MCSSDGLVQPQCALLVRELFNPRQSRESASTDRLQAIAHSCAPAGSAAELADIASAAALRRAASASLGDLAAILTAPSAATPPAGADEPKRN